MSFFAALITGFILGDLLWWRAAQRTLRSNRARIVAAAWVLLMLGGLMLILGSRFAGQMWDEMFPRPALSIIFIWHLLVIPLWLIWRLVRLVGLAVVRSRKRASDSKMETLPRREFLKAATLSAPAILTTGGAFIGERQLHEFRVRRLDAPIANLPPALDGLTIAQVSDIHVGRFTRGRVLEQIVRETNALVPDLTLLTGDLINFALRDLPTGIDLIRGLKARHGVFMCEGNHDLIESPSEFWRQADRAGLPLLRGTSEIISIHDTKVQVFGLPWAHGDQHHAAAVAALDPLRKPDAFPILLAHHPHAFDSAQNFPLMLAGHTHGGQLMLNEQLGFGPMLFRYWSGLYQRAGRTLVVSNGVGNWFPVRVAAPAEVLHLTLRRA